MNLEAGIKAIIKRSLNQKDFDFGFSQTLLLFLTYLIFISIHIYSFIYPLATYPQFSIIQTAAFAEQVLPV